MREKLNSNPTLQIALIGVLAIAAGFFLLTKGGGGESEAAPAAETAAPAAEAAAPAAVESEAGAVPVGAEAAVPTASIATLSSGIQAPPLPAAVQRAYKSSKTIALLVVRGGGVDDRFVAVAARSLAQLPEVDLIVVRAKHIARYGALTLGLDVERVPALIVVRPRRLSGGVLQATVDYGYQSPQSLVQAVLDVSYKGPEPAYHPN